MRRSWGVLQHERSPAHLGGPDMHCTLISLCPLGKDALCARSCISSYLESQARWYRVRWKETGGVLEPGTCIKFTIPDS
jgi:hypothetical protein